MGAAFVVTLREAFEASLILGIVYGYLEKIGARGGYRYVTWGGTVGLLTWHAWWMQQHARLMKGQVQHRIDEARAANRLWVVGLIAFTGVFREGAETVLFLWGILAQAGAGSGWGSLAGGVAGVAGAAAL